MTIIELQHARVRLALHRLQAGEGTTLLLLHALSGSAADWRVEELGWHGPAYALDLSGHGYSGHVRGGYTPELWVADADIALAALGDDALLMGAGISAYIALQLAGARPEAVRGAVLMPGAGLEGGGDEPDWSRLPLPLTASEQGGALRAAPLLDPAVQFAEEMVRPAWYAAQLAEAARQLVLLEDGAPRPAWWRALRDLPRAHAQTGGSAADALALLADRVELGASRARSLRTGAH